MNDIIELKGTKKRIADYLANEFNLSDDTRKSNAFIEYMSCFIDILENNYDTLISDEEDFQKDIPRSFSASYGIISPSANYFISINKFTYILVLALAKSMFSMDGAIAIIAFEFIHELVPNEDIALFHKLDQAIGESCIVLEAAKNKIRGIDDSYFEKFKGECINNNLKCSFNAENRCTCNPIKVHEICQKLCNEHILTKKEGKYFYIDLI